MIPRISGKSMGISVAAIIAGVTMYSRCSDSTPKTKVDPNTCHEVNMSGTVIKMQDGIKLQLKTRQYLMQNGTLYVRNNNSKKWTDANYEMNLYDYQKDTFLAVAKSTQENKDEVVLSKGDIKYIQEHPKKIEMADDIRERRVKSTKENKLVIDAYQNSYTVYHFTPNLTLSYDAHVDL